MYGFNINELLLWLPAVIIGLTFHEYAHGKVADWFGDPTPRYQGRLTLNPVVHLDPIGFLLLLVTHFGWAKPVQVNPLNFKGDRTKGMMLVALAGPFMNLIVAFTVVLIKSLAIPEGTMPNFYIMAILDGIIFINIYLALFNLIPVPPLDGSKILAGLLPSNELIFQLERYGTIILILLIFTNIVSLVLSPIASWLYNFFTVITRFIAGPFI